MIRFEHPSLLLLFLFIPIFISLFILARHQRIKKIKRFAERDLFAQLSKETSPSKHITKFVLLMLAFAFLTLALANPQSGSKVIEGERRGIDLMICLDVSNSMMAEDVAPNRLAAAKQALINLLQKLKNDRIGIVIFAGRAYTQLPLTADYGAARMFLEQITPEMIETQGTSLGSAIEMALLGLGGDPSSKSSIKTNRSQAILLVTDGEDHENQAAEMAKIAAEMKVKIYTIGVGLPLSVPIPIYKNGTFQSYKLDRQGNPVTTKLNEEMLAELARIGGGVYLNGNHTTSAVADIYGKINALEKNIYMASSFSEFESQYPTFLFISLVFLLSELFLIEKRSKYLNSLFIFGGKKN